MKVFLLTPNGAREEVLSSPLHRGGTVSTALGAALDECGVSIGEEAEEAQPEEEEEAETGVTEADIDEAEGIVEEAIEEGVCSLAPNGYVSYDGDTIARGIRNAGETLLREDPELLDTIAVSTAQAQQNE